MAEPTGRFSTVRFDADRDAWLAAADDLLAAARRYASPGHARIVLPGPEGGYGRDVDGLEGFARTFLLAGFRIAGAQGVGVDDLIDWYARGIATGTDPTAPDRWVRLDEHPQAKVEAASLAWMLDLTRPWIWDRLDAAVQQRVIAYLAPAVGDDTYPRINWVWFRLVVQTFLRSVGGPFSLDEMAADLATHDTFQRRGGWLSDGAERAYDHYVGWALHLYPTMWARMAGAADLAVPRAERDRAALDRYLQDAVELVGADGSPLLQGRSLIYRFAAAAPFWVGAFAGVPSVAPGLLRHAAGAIVGHFAAHGAPDERGLLSLGWHDAWPRLAQAYSGPGSPYWGSLGFLGIALPPEHPVWTDPVRPLPAERTDILRAVEAPGWVVASARGDGIVRVVNHGTDHAVEGAEVGDSPLYARLGYSTATCPVLDERGWSTPTDQSVTLIDHFGRSTHRAGMRTLTVGVQPGLPPVAVAGSTAAAHWVDPGPAQRDHGSGRAGRFRPAGTLTTYSLVRAAWEVRVAYVDDLDESVAAQDLRLRFGGWPVAGPATVATTSGSVTVRAADLLSHMASAEGTPGVEVHEDGGPLGGPVHVPWIDFPARVRVWTAVFIELSREPSRETAPGAADIAIRPGGDGDDGGGDGDGADVTVRWPDGLSSTHRLLRAPRRSPR
ncbi:DUF2264 domain-containing protein [Hamadaea tsunoensis]|uniref:DUF2264 domain-containing protein n=1 Tax=Hamadaea tsunoensis TaxID=53368 RepID=UPI00041A24FB|nr:DUF2264 domain-containing protein [Hamadaea tsunoensis]